MHKYHGSQDYIGAFHYVLLDILYAIPVIGLIFLLSHSFNTNNVIRLHYARSYFVRLLLVVLIIVLGGLALFLFNKPAFNDASSNITEWFKGFPNNILEIFRKPAR